MVLLSADEAAILYLAVIFGSKKSTCFDIVVDILSILSVLDCLFVVKIDFVAFDDICEKV